MEFLKQIVDSERVIRIEKNLLYNYLKKSASSEFYNNMFPDSPQDLLQPENLLVEKTQDSDLGEDGRRMEEIISMLEKRYKSDAVVLEIGGSRFQHRSANACNRFEQYIPLDISYSSILAYTEKFNKPGFVADACKLPFRDGTIDCIFTHTFLEHPLELEKVMSEIVRVLKPGGLVVHNDAWFCRWWQRYGIVGVKNFSSLRFREKLIFIAAKITELPIIRFPPIIVGRLVRKFFVPLNKTRKLRYKKLKPNYTLFLGYDEDAANRIDPFDVIRYYESRGFSANPDLSFMQKLLYPNTYIVLQKGTGTGVKKG